MKRWLRRIAISTIIIVATIYVLLVALMWRKQDSLVFSPSQGYRDLPESQGLQHENITLAVGSGVTVRGWFVRAKSSPLATILYFHGSGGNLSTYLRAIRSFAEAGFDSFSIDYEGYGESLGIPSESNTYRDADAAWSWLIHNRGVKPKRIAIWGASLGGGVAAHCAEMHTPGALVLHSTYTSLPDLGARLYPWLPVRLITHNLFSNLEKMPNIHAPVVIAHSREDDLIPFEMGQRLFSIANEPKVFVELKGAHNESGVSTTAILNVLVNFFEEAHGSVRK